jgi:hypothetical protein
VCRIFSVGCTKTHRKNIIYPVGSTNSQGNTYNPVGLSVTHREISSQDNYLQFLVSYAISLSHMCTQGNLGSKACQFSRLCFCFAGFFALSWANIWWLCAYGCNGSKRQRMKKTANLIHPSSALSLESHPHLHPPPSSRSVAPPPLHLASSWPSPPPPLQLPSS